MQQMLESSDTDLKKSVMDWIVSTPKSYVEAITLSLTIFGDVDFTEVIKIK